MATERNNTALEFETMLRRHLKRGGAPVAACAGFDFDTAGAYLEGALVRPERASYEAHLAGCAACRRHLIELSRLAQAAPHTAPQPASVGSDAPAWVRWRDVIAGRFDLSGWNLKWQMFGAAGAAFAMLIAALGVQSWRQASKPGNDQAEAAVAAKISPASRLELAAQTPTPEPSPEEEKVATDVISSVIPQDQQRAFVPKPPPTVGPTAGDTNVPVAASSESLALNTSQPGAAPSPDKTSSSSQRLDAQAEARLSSVELQRIPAAQPAAPTVLVSDAGNVDIQVLAKGQETAAPVLARDEARGNDIAARMAPPPGINPMNSDPALPAPKPARSRSQTEKLSSRVYKYGMALLPGVSNQEQNAKLEPLDDESFKSLTLRIRDKVFRFDKNMWIDQAYKPETQRWRVLPVKRGSKQYEQILAGEPLLKEFFDRGPILIVWKDKIYKVQ